MKTTQTPKNLRPYKVFAIENGTVIDHVTVGYAIRIIRLLNLPIDNRVVTTGLNFKSKTMGLKDIIKVENRELTPEEVSIIALFAPNASINIIRDFKVYKKFKVEVPKKIDKLVVCPNPKCITNHERMSTVFYATHNGQLKLKCHYCEKTFKGEEIKNYNI